MTDIQSPCIRECKLGADRLCISCYRNLEEIAHWKSYTADEKLKIIKALEQRKNMDKIWLEKVSIAYEVYAIMLANQGFDSVDVEHFITWLYKQYGIVEPKKVKNE